MKKILTALTLTASIVYAPYILTGAAKSPVDFEKLEKAVKLHRESITVNYHNQKERDKADAEVQKILISVFKKGKTLTADRACYFKKIKPERYDTFDQNRNFTLSCVPEYSPVRLMFQFIAESEASFIPRKVITENRYTKIFEDVENTAFTGKIEFVDDKSQYTGLGYGIDINRYNETTTQMVVMCKILSLKPVKVSD